MLSGTTLPGSSTQLYASHAMSKQNTEWWRENHRAVNAEPSLLPNFEETPSDRTFGETLDLLNAIIHALKCN